MNHSCAVIGVAVNVTQWAAPASRHKQRQTRYFASFLCQFCPISRNLSTRRKNNALHTKIKLDHIDVIITYGATWLTKTVANSVEFAGF